MSIKVCKIHGELSIDQVNIERRADGEIYYRCHECKLEKSRNYYNRNKKDILERVKLVNMPPESREKYINRVTKYRKTEKFKAYREYYNVKNKDVIKQKRKLWYTENYHKLKSEIQARRREIRNSNKEDVNAKRRSKYTPKLLVPRRKIPLLPREYQRLYRDKNIARARAHVANLSDTYVKQLLRLTSFDTSDIPKELLDIKRATVKIKRVMRSENK